MTRNEPPEPRETSSAEAKVAAVIDANRQGAVNTGSENNPSKAKSSGEDFWDQEKPPAKEKEREKMRQKPVEKPNEKREEPAGKSNTGKAIGPLKPNLNPDDIQELEKKTDASEVPGAIEIQEKANQQLQGRE